MEEAKKDEAAQPDLDKILETPMTQEEASDAIARINMQKAQLAVIRVRLAGQLNDVDLQLARAEFERSVVIRRAMLAQTVDKKEND